MEETEENENMDESSEEDEEETEENENMDDSSEESDSDMDVSSEESENNMNVVLDENVVFIFKNENEQSFYGTYSIETFIEI